MVKPPVMWAEVYSRAAKEWMPVDPTRKKIRCKNIMEPALSNPDNKMLYVVAYEEGEQILPLLVQWLPLHCAMTATSTRRVCP